MTDKTAIEAMARVLAAHLEFGDSDPEAMWPAYLSDAQAALDAYHEWLKANGFAVVPVEPTEAMRLEGVINFGDVRNIYRAMIAAAQGRE